MTRSAPSVLRSQLAIAALFCFLGFQYGTWVSQVPALQGRLGLGKGELGLLLLAPGIGAALSFPLVTALMERWGPRRLGSTSAVVLLAVLAALAAARTFPVALLVLAVDGVAIACLNVAMNAQGARLEAEHRRAVMARLHAVFSAGLLCAALLTSAVTAAGGSLPVHFAIGGAILVLLLALSLTGARLEDVAAPVPGDRGRERAAWQLPAAVTVLLTLAMAFAELTEGAMNDWSALYLKDVAGAPADLTPLGIAAFSGTMLAVRFLVDTLRRRWGDRRVVLAGTTAAAAGLTGALLTSGLGPALSGFACVGAGMAAVTPCIYVAAARTGPAALSLVASFGTIGLLAGPPVIGFVADRSGLAWGMAVVVAAMLLVAACVRLATPATSVSG
ncbi:MFS transporter [Kitasatospora sp. NPDC006697]|uniref:MFS transporter n=1 Tax=Kitasatospora sp. NPDC006697 TaxID=3364020 RepID=UPI0036C8DB4A